MLLNKGIGCEQITRDPSVCGCEPVTKGTRVTLRTVLASLASGDGTAEVMQEFPTLEEYHVRAANAFAAASAAEDLLPRPLHRVA